MVQGWDVGTDTSESKAGGTVVAMGSRRGREGHGDRKMTHLVKTISVEWKTHGRHGKT